MLTTFSSAARFALVLLAGHNGASQLGEREAAAWRVIQPETVVLRDGTYVAGRAALIDSKGYFIAHRTSVPAGVLQGQTSDGKTFKLVRAAVDEPSGMVLLIAQGWTQQGHAAVQVPEDGMESGTPLMAVNAGGPIPTEFVSSNRFGVLSPSQRMVPLVEVKFESSSQLVGGALLFTYDGRFMGALNATLDARSDDSLPAQSLTLQPRNILKAARKVPQNNFGPNQLTVAYTVGLNSLRAVIEGFKTPTHEVWRPQLGVFCKDAEGGGAFVESVIPNSPAERSGLRAGDVIFQVAQSAIHTKVDFAKAMLLQTAGAEISVGFLRNGDTRVVHVVLGKSKD